MTRAGSPSAWPPSRGCWCCSVGSGWCATGSSPGVPRSRRVWARCSTSRPTTTPNASATRWRSTCSTSTCGGRIWCRPTATRWALAGPALVVGFALALARLVRLGRAGGAARAGLMPVAFMAAATLLLVAVYLKTPYSALGEEGAPILVKQNARYLLPALMLAAPLLAWGLQLLGRFTPWAELALLVVVAEGLHSSLAPGASAVAEVLVALALLAVRGIRPLAPVGFGAARARRPPASRWLPCWPWPWPGWAWNARSTTAGSPARTPPSTGSSATRPRAPGSGSPAPTPSTARHPRTRCSVPSWTTRCPTSARRSRAGCAITAAAGRSCGALRAGRIRPARRRAGEPVRRPGHAPAAVGPVGRFRTGRAQSVADPSARSFRLGCPRA